MIEQRLLSALLVFVMPLLLGHVLQQDIQCKLIW